MNVQSSRSKRRNSPRSIETTKLAAVIHGEIYLAQSQPQSQILNRPPVRAVVEVAQQRTKIRGRGGGRTSSRHSGQQEHRARTNWSGTTGGSRKRM